MVNKVNHKRSAVAGKIPSTTDLELGQLAINTTDGKLFLKKSDGGSESIIDVGKDSETAVKLKTPPNIGGVSFDGTADITLPGVNAAGNQNTTGNAATATKLQTARTIALSGDVTGSATFDGSSNVSITATVANDSHTHDTRYPVLSAERVLAAVPAGSWVTIAQVPSNGGRAYGEFIVYDNDSGKHNAVKIIASHSYGQSVVACIGGNRYGTRTIAHVRVLYGTADRVYSGAKLQVYIENTCALRVRALMIKQINGWSAWSEMTPMVEGTPAGWAEDTTTRYDDITNTATGFSGSFSGSGALLTGLNAANLASGTIPDARLSGTYTGVNITGNAATATKLATARTINGVSFDGTANIETTEWVHSGRDFVNGTLISTSIDYSGSTGDPWVLEIRGNSYGAWVPFDIQYQGYIYNDTIINHGGYSNGTNISGMVALNVGGQLCFWFPRQSYWQGFNVRVYSALAGRAANRVLSITNSAKPAGTKEVALSVNIQQSLHSGNFNSYSPTLTGGGASGTWGISITGSSASTTGNAATATKLATARTINGVAFDGTANITVSDPTSLWTPRATNFTAAAGSRNTLLASVTASLPANPALGDTVEFIKLASVTPIIKTTDGRLIQVKGQSDTSVTYNYDARLLAVFNGAAWEI